MYAKLEERARYLAQGLREAATKAGVPVTQTRVGSMLGMFFTEGPVVDYQTAKTSNTAAYAKFFQRMLASGVYFAPSQFEAAFLSTAHTTQHLSDTIKSARRAFRSL